MSSTGSVNGFSSSVTPASSEALQLAADHRHAVDVLVTDVMLPEMSGLELAGRLRELRPGVRALFVTGHSRETMQASGGLPPGSAVLEKPFDGASLVRLVRELMMPQAGA